MLEAEIEELSKMLVTLLSHLKIKAELVMHTSDVNSDLAKHVSQTWKALNVSQTQVIDATVPDDGLTLQLVTHDSLEREWNILSLAVRPSGTEYVASDGEFKQNYEIEFRIIIERLFAYYLEEHEGDLPYWASPVQAIIIPISEGQTRFSEKVSGLLESVGLRTKLDSRAETMQARIREAEMDSVPLIVIIGEKEQNADAVSLRMRDKQEVGMISTDELASTVFGYLERS
jgi:threonyl-tRNA synthetase